LGIKLKYYLQWTPFPTRFLVRNLSQCLMNRNQDCTNISIEQKNISKLIHFDPSVLFALENFIARIDLTHCLYNGWEIFRASYHYKNDLSFWRCAFLHCRHAASPVLLPPKKNHFIKRYKL
jgi:hypothetical protein